MGNESQQGQGVVSGAVAPPVQGYHPAHAGQQSQAGVDALGGTPGEEQTAVKPQAGRP